ncbi:uncharacterized protein LOC105845888 [Hydra vulgaris]|uniref:Uncharacterized protein LOC105845888 n=1 Tax=Hydra vulgaris TaxID=6087 RepID=A0ABM4D5U8_HYDVU
MKLLNQKVFVLLSTCVAIYIFYHTAISKFFAYFEKVNFKEFYGFTKGNIFNFYSEIYGLNKETINNSTCFNKASLIFNTRPLCSNLKLYSSNVLSYAYYQSARNKTYRNYITDVINEVKSSKLYQNWSVRIYHNVNDMYNHIYDEYENLFFCDVRKTPYLGDLSNIDGMMWRFLPVGDLTVDVVCSRDLDSPILEREEDAVSYWLKSDKMSHVMRDHLMHTSSIMGGLWCIKPFKNRLLAERLFALALSKSSRRNSKITPPYGSDQHTLNQYIWPLIKNDIMIHDSYRCNGIAIPFPTKRNQSHLFVGCPRPCKIKKIQTCPVKCRKEKDWLYC